MSFYKISNIEEQLDKIRKFLPEYLKEFGHDISNNRKIICINPKHDDSSPSMSSFETAKGHHLVKCFSCGFVGDIFNAAHIFEHKPIMGPGFVDDTVVYLANKFGIELNIQTMSDDEIYEMNAYQAYKSASEFISKSTLNNAQLAELQKRGWDELRAKKLGIGGCQNTESLVEHLKSIGYSLKFLSEIDLDNENLFSPNNLIFAIHDDYGRPVGFMARNLRFDGVKDDHGRFVNGPKFINTKSTKLNIYSKNERLYLFHESRKKNSSIYVFEGNGDAVTANLAGLSNASAICGVNINEHHFNLCRRHGIYDVIICLDADEAGLSKAKGILDDILKNIHDIRIRFIFLPEKIVVIDGESKMLKTDPDEFIRNNGLDAFLALPKIDPFSWRLTKFLEEEEMDNEAICFAMIPIITSEPSSIRRESMIKELAEFTGISDKAIRDEIDRVINADEDKLNKAKESVISEVMNALSKKSIQSAETILSSGLDKIYSLQKEHKGGTLDTNTRMTNLLAIKEYQEQEDLHTIYNFGQYFRTLNTALSGDLRGKVITLGGVGNTGKTSTLVNWSWNLVNENEGSMAVFLTIDDSDKEFIPRVICYDVASRLYTTNPDLFNMLNINKVGTPYLFKDNFEYEAIMQEREISYKKLFSLAKDDRYVVLDSTDGRTLDFVQTIIRTYTERYPSRHLFFFLDNFHLMQVPGYEDGRTKYKHASHEIKNSAVKHNCTVVMTAEYKKVPPDRKPNNNDLGETVALEYDSNCIIHLDSELHRCREQTRYFFMTADGTNNKYPIVESIFGKNKVNSYKGSVYYKFYPDKAFYAEISEHELNSLAEANGVYFYDADDNERKEKD